MAVPMGEWSIGYSPERVGWCLPSRLGLTPNKARPCFAGTLDPVVLGRVLGCLAMLVRVNYVHFVASSLFDWEGARGTDTPPVLQHRRYFLPS